MKPKNQAWLLVALLAVMLIVYMKPFKPPVDNADPAAMPALESAATVEAVAVAAHLPDVDISHRESQRVRAGEVAWARDPFSKGIPEGQVGGLVLSGILWDAQAPMAIINGQMIGVGGEAEGYRIVAIMPDKVLLSDGAETYPLMMSY